MPKRYEKVPESELSEEELMRVYGSKGKGRYERRKDPIDRAMAKAKAGVFGGGGKTEDDVLNPEKKKKKLGRDGKLK